MDCNSCVPPRLSANEDAEKIYMVVQDQLILGGMGGAVAVNQMAIHAAMELYNVADKRACFDKVVMVSRAVTKAERDAKE